MARRKTHIQLNRFIDGAEDADKVMGRRLTQCVVFGLGVAVALLLGYATKGPSSNALARTAANPNLVSRPNAANTPIVWTHDTRANGAAGIESENNELTDRLESMSPEVRRAFLVEAVRDGSAASLRNISSRAMSVLPEYRKDILPVLKREALSVLVSRFREIDWTNWPLSSYARDGGPTPGRSYVDLVFAANPELGRFLETGAQLFHRLFAVTEQGKVFTPAAELQRVLATAEQARADRAQGLIPASRLLDAGILQDPVFGLVLEQLRAQLVGNYLQVNRKDPLTSLELLLSVHPAAGATELSPEFVRVLRLFALDATARYREEVFERLQESTNLESVAKNDPVLGRALSELYLVGGMDAIEHGDQARALLYIDQSNHFFPGLRAQELLAELIRMRNQPREEPRTQVAARQPEPEAEESGVLTLGRKSEPSPVQASISTGMSYLSVGVFALVILGALFFVFVYFRSVRSLSAPALSPVTHTPTSPMRMTSPTDVNFGNEPETERRVANA